MTIEQLKKEVGQVKVTRLSHKKMQLEYSIKIYSRDLVIGTQPLKIRYKMDGEMYPIKDAVFNKLSHKYAIKKKHVGIMISRFSDPIYSGDDFLFQPMRVPTHISFNDGVWHRDRILHNLLAQS